MGSPGAAIAGMLGESWAGALGKGLLCALPAWALLAARYLSLRPSLDRRARRSYLTKASAFAAAALAATALVAAAGGRLALPSPWAALLALAAVLLASRSFGA
ncbi:MAG TPA: hypothetical protein PLB91_02935 [Spirochaetales bacterium]|nr:hypothetical protein [Spirochaetales bacterium]HRY55763.1 hypothetical protein [Spirochaetia bacterium]HRZ63342.1 hypothetical protein [Spirochaetia bacterium]